MSGSTTTATPTLHVNNIFGSPATSLLGIGALLSGAGQQLATTGIPSTPVGWFSFGLSMLTGLYGLFLKSN